MNIDTYPTQPTAETEFRFFSEGKNGRFEMRICFEQIHTDLYNLAFGVYDISSGKLEDSKEIRNGDMDKILGTVANVALSFLKLHPKQVWRQQGEHCQVNPL